MRRPKKMNYKKSKKMFSRTASRTFFYGIFKYEMISLGNFEVFFAKKLPIFGHHLYVGYLAGGHFLEKYQEIRENPLTHCLHTKHLMIRISNTFIESYAKTHIWVYINYINIFS